MKRLIYVSNLMVLCFVLFSISVKAQVPVITTNPANTTICSGSTAILTIAATNTPTAYYWQSSVDSGATWHIVWAGGAFSGVTTDSLHITAATAFTNYWFRCYAINGVDTSLASAHAVFTVDTNLVSGVISGATHVCVGSTITLSDSSLMGGTWGSRTHSMDTLNNMGVLYGIAAGTDSVWITATNTCGTVSTFTNIRIDSLPYAGVIYGAMSICPHNTDTLHDTMRLGGTWSSSNLMIDSISHSGVVYGISGGVDTIYYSYSDGRCIGKTEQIFTVNPAPNAGMILGGDSVCHGATITLTSTVSGGIWRNINRTIDTINTAGIVYGIMPGMDTIWYKATNSCGGDSVYMVFRVDSAPAAYSITGPTSVCISGSITLENRNTEGAHVWSASNGNASALFNGHIIGIMAGIDTITYTFTNACGTVSSSIDITIQAPLTVRVITGTRRVCTGSDITLTDATTGGYWISGNSSIATIDGPGLVTGRGQGTVAISYLLWNSCGASVDTYNVHVYRDAAMITGNDSVGVGFVRVLTDSTWGGVWTSSNNAIATVDSVGNVTGVSVGFDTITYTVTNFCGTSMATKIMQVGTLVIPGYITGPDSVCFGVNTVYSDTILGGIWSLSNSNATVRTDDSSEGVVMGLVPYTYDTLYYTYNTGFGAVTLSKVIYIDTLPYDSIYYYQIISLGGSYPLKDSIVGGHWSTANPGVWTSSDPLSISIVGNFMVVLKPSTHDSVTISHTVNNACGSLTYSVVYQLRAAGIKNINANISSLNVYPNPSQGSISVNLISDVTEPVTITVCNMVGEKVKEFTTVSNTANDITLNQPDGVYFLTANTATGKYETKIVLTK